MPLRQQVRFIKASDGIRLALAESGMGPTLVKAANWLTHLEYEWESPVWKHWIRFFSEHTRFIRFDAAPNGDQGGAMCAQVQTVWVLIDQATGRPKRVPPWMVEMFA